MTKHYFNLKSCIIEENILGVYFVVIPNIDVYYNWNWGKHFLGTFMQSHKRVITLFR